MSTLTKCLALAIILVAEIASAETDAATLEDEIIAKYQKGDGELDVKAMLRDVAIARKRQARAKRTGVVLQQVPQRIDIEPSSKKSQPTSLPTLSAVFVGKDCEPETKALFVRSDPLDNFHYLVDPQYVADAKGASVSYTNNLKAGTQTAVINGRVSYLLFGEQCGSGDRNPHDPFISSVGIAPFISFNGTWDLPLKATSTSAIKYGVDFQASLSTTDLPLVKDHYFYVSPYHQSDFRNLADINAVTLAYEPVAPQLFIDSGPVTPYFSFFWQLRAEADFVDVNNRGLTNLIKGNHTWLGETVRANLALFPLNAARAWPDWLGGRFSLIATADNYRDVSNSVTARYYTIALQYKLGECKKDNTKPVDTPCAIQGASSISLEYDQGTNRDTLVGTNQYLIKFGYAY